MTDVIDINTRKKKTLRVKNKVLAQRWERFIKLVDAGLITITVAGTVLNKVEVEAFGETLDAEAAEEAKIKTRLKVRKHRSKKLTDS